MVNQQAALNGQPTVGFINPAIYAIGKGSTYGSGFHDITTGGNPNSHSPTRFFAVSGYDLCTGWGSPTGNNLINLLAPSPVAFQITGIAEQGNDILITWQTSVGSTNALQATVGGANGSYNTNNFAAIFTVTNSVGTTTNYVDVGGATNAPARYYRVRLVP